MCCSFSNFLCLFFIVYVTNILFIHPIVGCVDLTMNFFPLTLHYFLTVGKYNNERVLNDDISHIEGPWIKSAKNITYKNNMLCADLRAGKYYTNNRDRSTISTKYLYKRNCTHVDRLDYTKLINENGNFKSYNTYANDRFSQNIGSIPRGPWIKKASRWSDSITFFPNTICAEFYKGMTYVYESKENNNVEYSMYEEDCIDYSDSDTLDCIDGKFIIMQRQEKINYFKEIRNKNANNQLIYPLITCDKI